MYIIIGAGPTGLSLAWYLSKINEDVIIIEREAEIGGCHRVRRVNGLFTEHGPRIYLNNYLNFMHILKDMDLNFYDLFTKYDFPISKIGGSSFEHFSFKNIFTLILSYLNFALYPNAYKSITMLEYSNHHNFSTETKDYIDRLCRLTDGAGIDRFTVYEFFELINQNVFYNIYQPKLPNDKGLFKYWQEKLVKNGVKIMLNTDVISVNQNSITIMDKVTNKTRTMQADKYIFALPPLSVTKILQNSPNMRNIFGPYNQLSQWANETKYLTYIPIIFHWDKQLKLPKVWGFPASDWGIVFIVLSDYMQFDNPQSKTVISTCITKPNSKSTILGLTPNECDESTLINETFRQLKESFPNLLPATHSILSPGVYHDDKQWHTKDTSFVFTTHGYLKKYNFEDNYENRIYQIGTQNGNSFYSFTSMESAITNALYLLKEIEPNKYGDIKIEEPYTINKFLLIFFITRIIIIVAIIWYFYSPSK